MDNPRARFFATAADLFDGGLIPMMPGWAPTEKQLLALNSPADELLYGGAAGCGKSELLLAAGRTTHTSSLLVRRNYSMLTSSLIPRAILRFGGSKHYMRGEKTWRWPDGRSLRFGHLQYDHSPEMYLSSEYDGILVDELTQLALYQYLQMLHVNRTNVVNQHCRIIGATNPGGIGNDWVMERWAPWLDETYPKPAKPLELRWFIRIDERDHPVPDNRPVLHRGEKLMPTSRTYLPARVVDNPHVSPGYVAKLQAMPEPLRSQRLYGDWKAGLIEDANQTIPRKWLRAAMNRWKPRDPVPRTPPIIGVDVAAGGNDQTVFARRWGNWWAPLLRYPGAHTPTGGDVMKRLVPHLIEGGIAAVDAEGIGLATMQAAREAGMLSRFVPVKFGAGTSEWDSSRNLGFMNVRALMYWRLRELLDPDRKLAEGEDLPAIPPDPELFTDLTAPKFEVRGNKILLEPKDDIRKRIGRSPDQGDALVLTFGGRRTDLVRLAALLEARRAGPAA